MKSFIEAADDSLLVNELGGKQLLVMTTPR